MIIATLNVVSLLLLVYVMLQLVGEARGRVYSAMDRLFSFILSPLRKLMPVMKIDLAAIVLIAILRLIVFFIKRGNL
ncbi:MAG: YggT family protein [Candidatus Krumholzibacteriales bacterium]